MEKAMGGEEANDRGEGCAEGPVEVQAGAAGPGRGEGYVVIARKWRPATFDDVVGQEHVTRTLKNAITSGRVAHAYLFTGPRGVGKTTVARILAKSLNCAQAPTIQPCEACPACAEIAQGTSMDVIEIDGASNRGIDEIRNLRDSVRYAPVGGKTKVYIIDEVHMLTTEAFNALLKTLEEPPPHVVFVFATTQPLKVPQTIVSRCQRFDFRRIATADIAARLAEICKGDGYKCEPAALALIAQQADGSMRDAQSMLEQVLAFSGGTATEADIKPIMGLRGSALLSKIGRAIVDGEEKQVMELLGEAFDAGVDPIDLATTLIEWIRYLLITSIDPDSRELLSLAPEMKKDLAEQAKALSSEHLLSILGMLTQAEDSLKRASHQRYLLETVILRMTRIKSVAKVSDLIKVLEGMEGGRSGPRGATGASGAERKTVGSRPAASPTGKPKEKGPSNRTDSGTTDMQDSAAVSAAPGRPAATAPAPAPARADLKPSGDGSDAIRAWPRVIESLRETKASLASILDHCNPPSFADGALWLMLPSAFYQGQILKGDNLRILTQKIVELTNTNVVLKTKVGEVAVPKREDAPEDTSKFDAIAERNPVVRALIENLGGKIVDVRRGRTGGPGEGQAS